MNVILKTVALVLATNTALAFTTPEVRVKLLDKDNRPVAGMPVVMQTEQFDITKVLTPHSNMKYINSQRVVLTDKSGVASLPGSFLLRTPKGIIVDIGYAVSCESQGTVYEHQRRAVITSDSDALKFKIQNEGAKQNWLCSLYADDKDSSDLQMNDLVCKTNASAEEAIAALRALVQNDKNNGCTVEKNF